jgi:hypothetical protein
MPIPASRGIAGAGTVLAALAIVAGGCKQDSGPVPPAPDAASAVRESAERTLDRGPAGIRIRVSSPLVEYSIHGAIELARERFRARAHVTRAPYTHFVERVETIGLRGEIFQIVHGEPGFDNLAATDCAFDPHALVGSYGGAVSLQEAVALVGVAIRLLRDGLRAATVAQRNQKPSATYSVVVDPRAVSDPDMRRSDEWTVVNPPRLARHLAPIGVTIDSAGLIRRLALELRHFPPPARGPGIAREHRRERVSISVSLGDFGRALEVKSPRCIAME